LPSTPTFKSSTVFFKIKPVFRNGKFYLVIYVNRFFYLKSFYDNLYENSLISPFKTKKAKKWVIIASDKQIAESENTGLKFYFHHSPHPFVGVIDDNGNPVDSNTQSDDVLKYFEILSAYKHNRDVSMEIEDFIKKYPNSVFLPDILFLKLKILDKKNESGEVIELSKVWIKKFAYDENLPKVLLLMANNYSKMS
jgi:TolA-binding protein